MVGRGLRLRFSEEHHHRLMFFRKTLLKETEGVEGGQQGGFQEIKTFGKLKEHFPTSTGKRSGGGRN